MHPRQLAASGGVADNLNRSADNGIAPTPVNGKHLICLRDLTKHRSDAVVGDLSPREMKYIPPPLKLMSSVSSGGDLAATVMVSGAQPTTAGGGQRQQPSSNCSPSETTSTRSLIGSPPTSRRSSTPKSATSSIDYRHRRNNSQHRDDNDDEDDHDQDHDQMDRRLHRHDQPPPPSAGSRGHEARSPAGATTAITSTSSSSSTGASAAAAGCEGQLNKLKRFLATVQQFADDVSPDIGDRVRTLVLALVNSQLSVEEFHRRLHETTNFPLRPFVIPFLKANLPLLQEELTACNGDQSPLPSPTGPDRPTLVPAVRPSPAALHRELSLAAFHGPSLPADQRQRPWYLGSLMPGGTLFPRGGGSSGLDLNANGKRPSAFDRISDSPIDLKVDLFNPAAKRLHIDIPAQRPVPGPDPYGFNPAVSGAGGLTLRPDEQLSTTARDLTTTDRDRLQRNGVEHDRGPASFNGNSSGSHFTGRCRTDPHMNSGSSDDFDDEWLNVDSILQSIVTMVDRCRRAMAILRDNCRRDGRNMDRVGPLSGGGGGPIPGLGAALRRSPGSDGLVGGLGANNVRLTDDLQVLQVRQLAEEAVNEVKRQAVAELHRAVAAAEVKATVTVTAERARLEKVMNDVRAQARQEAFAILNNQEDSSENCWNCGRKAYETCSGCHRARYCGTFCQHRHWETHHLTCKPSRTAATSTTAAATPTVSSAVPAVGLVQCTASSSPSSAADDARSPQLIRDAAATGRQQQQRRSPSAGRSSSRTAAVAGSTPRVEGSSFTNNAASAVAVMGGNETDPVIDFSSSSTSLSTRTSPMSSVTSRSAAAVKVETVLSSTCGGQTAGGEAPGARATAV